MLFDQKIRSLDFLRKSKENRNDTRTETKTEQKGIKCNCAKCLTRTSNEIERNDTTIQQQASILYRIKPDDTTVHTKQKTNIFEQTYDW